MARRLSAGRAAGVQGEAGLSDGEGDGAVDPARPLGGVSGVSEVGARGRREPQLEGGREEVPEEADSGRGRLVVRVVQSVGGERDV